jgi:hypothetical protein
LRRNFDLYYRMEHRLNDTMNQFSELLYFICKNYI